MAGERQRASAPPEPRLVVRDASPMVDEPLALHLVGVPPGSVVRLRASCRDPHDREFASWAELVAGPDGSLDPAHTSARAGAYEGVDPFGLWWSMTSQPERAFGRDLRPIATVVEASIGEATVARVELSRLRVRPDVRVERVTDEGLVATLFVPEPTPAPGVVVLGGSEGGIALAEELAALLASHGFVALALAYFGCDELPPRLVEIPVEYVLRAIEWLARRTEAAAGRVGAVGVSRGAELALLSATIESRIRAVVGFSASGVMWPGFDPGSPTLRSAWAHEGKPLAFAVPRPGSKVIRVHDSLVATLEDPATERAWVALERIRGTVLLISGGEDGLWPARQLAEAAMRRLAAASRHDAGHQHLHYPCAGHGVGRLLGLPAAPIASSLDGGGKFDLGGSRAANARSAEHAWPRVLAFLARQLDGPQDLDVRRRSHR